MKYEVVKFIEIDFEQNTCERAAKILLQLGSEGYNDSYDFTINEEVEGVLVTKLIDLRDELEDICECYIKGEPYTLKNGVTIIIEKI